jgi:ATP/maltotriose-dependent transcriptional regulator MalT
MAVLGFLDLSLGDPAAAHRQLAGLAALVTRIGVGEPGVVRFVPDAVEALVGLADLEAAEALLGPFEERAAAMDRPWAQATAARSRALVAATRGEWELADAAIAHAIRIHERLHAPFERARTLLVKGSIQRRSGRRAAARRTLEDALAAFTGLETPLWVERTRLELASLPGRAPRPAHELTPREWEIARLVTHGLTNREIAARLFLSERTVEWNLSRLYDKVGVRSRMGLARALATDDHDAGEAADKIPGIPTVTAEERAP